LEHDGWTVGELCLCDYDLTGNWDREVIIEKFIEPMIPDGEWYIDVTFNENGKRVGAHLTAAYLRKLPE